MNGFGDAALVLAGHGSTLNAESGEPVWRHADTFRRQGRFAEVQECFWKLEPSFSSVLHLVISPRVFVVPLFITEGYFTRRIIPRELGLCRNGAESFPRVQQRGGRRIHYTLPVGTHPRMTRVLAERAKGTLDRHPFPFRPPDADVSLFIAGHGTGNDANSRRIVEEQARRLGEEGDFHDVHAVFMEEEPRIERCYELAGCSHLVVVPFFISDGLHSFEDIPVMLGEPAARVAERMAGNLPTWKNPTSRNGKLVWYSRSIGLDPGMTGVILDRVREIDTGTA